MKKYECIISLSPPIYFCPNLLCLCIPVDLKWYHHLLGYPSQNLGHYPRLFSLHYPLNPMCVISSPRYLVNEFPLFSFLLPLPLLGLFYWDFNILLTLTLYFKKCKRDYNIFQLKIIWCLQITFRVKCKLPSTTSF